MSLDARIGQLIMVGVTDGLDAADQAILAPVFGADPVRAPEPLPLAMAILNLLAAAAAGRPLLVQVDDVHWFDELSAVVLSVIGRRLSDPRVRAAYLGE